MKVHFFPKEDITSATARYRAYLLAEELNRRGLAAIVHQPPGWRPAFKLSRKRFREFTRHFKILAAVKKDEVIYLVRTVYQIDFLILIMIFKILFAKKIIFDFDDPLFLRPKMDRKMKIMTRIADAVFVGSHYLADWAGRYNKNVYLVPTSVPLAIYEKYGREKSEANSVFTIGWVGIGPNHYENFKLLVPVFQKLIEEGIDFKFVLVGALQDQKLYRLFQEINGLKAEFIDDLDWQDPANVAKEIQKFDLGVMPLIDNKVNRGKCSFKAIECMACGVPVVISAVGENNYLIQDGRNGYLAKTASEWIAKIKSLYRDRELAGSIGQEGQRTIREKYSYEAQAPKIIKIIKELVN